MPGSIVHAPRGDEGRDAQQSLCGTMENPTSPWAGTLGTLRTMNCAQCFELARARDLIHTP